jgi:hypothetical protein
MATMTMPTSDAVPPMPTRAARDTGRGREIAGGAMAMTPVMLGVVAG